MGSAFSTRPGSSSNTRWPAAGSPGRWRPCSRKQLKFGIGVAENTALVVTGGNQVKVIGDHGAVVMDLSKATGDPAVEGFNLKNARLSYLDRGDSSTWRRWP